MSWLNMLSIAVALAMDAFAVAVAVGLLLPKVTARHVYRLALHFGLFQFMMPILGWVAGFAVSQHVAAYDHWVAFGLLVLLGAKMLHGAISETGIPAKPDPTRGLMLIALSLATSVDALAVGLSLAFLRVSIWLPSVVIGLVAALLTVVGIRFGARLGARWRRWAALAGGVVLLIIGLRILLSHLMT